MRIAKILVVRRGKMGGTSRGGTKEREGLSEEAVATGGANEASISVLVADDHPIVREHLAGAICADERLELVGEANDGEEALRKVEQHHPNVVVLDVAMPALDGAGVLKRLREREVPIRVLLLPGHANVVQMRNALRYDPDSLLLMNESVGGICEEIVAMVRGDDFSPGRINLERAQMLAHNGLHLTSRESNVLRLSAEGLSRAEIARQLDFAPSTVRDIRRDICAKSGAASIQTAIVIAMRMGLLN